MDSSSIIAIRKKTTEIAQSRDLTEYTVDIKPLSTNGHVGDTFKVILQGLLNTSIYEKKFFVKKCTQDAQSRILFDMNNRFKTEIFAYSDLIPKLNVSADYCDSKDIKVPTVKFYGGSSKENEEFILLEYLADHVACPMKFFKPYEAELRAAIETVGKYHALSLATKQIQPEAYAELVKKMKEMAPTRTRSWARCQEFFSDLALDVLENPKQISFLKRIRNDITTAYTEAFEKSKHKIICHGDCHLWNFIFKYNENFPGGIESCKMLDFQTVDYCAPSADLHCLLGAMGDMSASTMQELIDLHYNTMKNTLSQLNIDISKMYPRVDYDKDYKDAALEHVRMAAFCHGYMCVSYENFSSDRNLLQDLFSGNMTQDDVIVGDEKVKFAIALRKNLDELFKLLHLG